jgi:hypothetical protein
MYLQRTLMRQGKFTLVQQTLLDISLPLVALLARLFFVMVGQVGRYF